MIILFINIIDAFPNTHHLRALQKVSDEDQARIQIFKLLLQVNFEVLSEKYSNVKKDRFGYDFYNFETIVQTSFFKKLTKKVS